MINFRTFKTLRRVSPLVGLPPVSAVLVAALRTDGRLKRLCLTNMPLSRRDQEDLEDPQTTPAQGRSVLQVMFQWVHRRFSMWLLERWKSTSTTLALSS